MGDQDNNPWHFMDGFGQRDDKASNKLLIRLQMALPGHYLSEDEVDVYEGKQAVLSAVTVEALLRENELLKAEKNKP